ncbi:MAG: hypothetical protein Q8P52_00630 [bacterium]|nr:hypothetical protein [bacterium]
MKPLSRRKRYAYLVFCYALFLILIPVIVLYAEGYRIVPGPSLVKTGGIYIYETTNGASIFIDNKKTARLSALSDNFFIQRLIPGIYNVRVQKDGFFPWEKEIAVYDGRVSENASFLLPEKIYFTNISATSTLRAEESIKLVQEAEVLFSEKDTTNLLTNGQVLLLENLSRKVFTVVYSEKNDIFLVGGKEKTLEVLWRGSGRLPYFFCLYDMCSDSFSAFYLDQKILDADFYPKREDVSVIRLTDGIYVAELDRTPLQHIRMIYEGENLDFRLSDNRIYVKDGKYIYTAPLP